MDLLAALASYRASVKGRDPLETTRIEFINLDPLRERYGERWPKVRERIFDVCQAFIQRRIGPGDMVMRAATGFMVLPGPDRDETAHVFTERIQSELKAFFLGVEDFDGLSVAASVASLPASSLFSAVESPAMAVAAAAHEAIEAAPDEPEGPPVVREAEPPRLLPFRLIFEPVWTAASGFVALHEVAPQARTPSGGVTLRGASLAPSQGGPAMRMELDRRVLQAAGRAWCEAPARPRGVLAVPVHYETLATLKYRLPYLAAFSTLSSDARGALMLIVRGAPAGAPYTRITEVCRSAKAVFWRVIFEIDLEQVRLDRFVDARVDVFEYRAPALINARVQDTMARLHADAARLGARCAVSQCTRADQLMAALDAGGHYITGPLVGLETRTMRAPYRFDLAAEANLAAAPEKKGCPHDNAIRRTADPRRLSVDQPDQPHGRRVPRRARLDPGIVRQDQSETRNHRRADL